MRGRMPPAPRPEPTVSVPARSRRPRTGGPHVDAVAPERVADRLLVVDDEPEVTGSIGLLRGRRGEREELIAHVDERHPTAVAAAELELEEAVVPVEGLLDVADLERDVIDANETHTHIVRLGAPD
jgi:hypothetical protein